MFGEVYDANPAYMSTFTTAGKLPATLDFGFQDAAQQFVAGKNATVLRDLFAGDDYYTDTDSNAYELPTFLGNHDMGRLPALLGHGRQQAEAGRAGQPADVPDPRPAGHLLRRRAGLHRRRRGQGRPAGHVRHQDDSSTPTRPTCTAPAATGAKDRYGTDTALYMLIKQLSALRSKHPTLADGAQISRYADAGPGIYAFSRINPKDGREYIVAVNNSDEPRVGRLRHLQRPDLYRPVYGTDNAVPSRRDGRVKVTVPALGVSVWKAERRVDAGAGAPVLLARAPGSGADFTGRAKISGAVLDDRFAQVTFAWRLAGDTDVDQARHRRQRPVRGLPRRLEPAQGLAGRVPAGRQGPARAVRRGHDVRASWATKGTDAEGPGDGRGAGDPAGQRLASRATTTPRWVAPGTGSRTATRPS